MTSLFGMAHLCAPICACILMSELKKKKICTLEALKGKKNPRKRKKKRKKGEKM